MRSMSRRLGMIITIMTMRIITITTIIMTMTIAKHG